MASSAALQEFFDRQRLAEAGQRRHGDYASAEPYPHIVLDDFFPEALLAELAEAIESPNAERWITRQGSQALKRGCADETVMDPSIQAFLHHLNAGPFLCFLEALTGVEGLLGDPHLQGGGLHQIERGGFLKVHADFNYHERLRLDRRLNLLVYLNQDWEDAYGGDLELWDRHMNRCVRKVLPIFNRCVVFSTTDDSFHGHPDPLQCPEGVTRKSIALYYYTNGRPKEERSAPHSTLYKARPGEASGGGRLGEIARRWSPPILLDAARGIRRRLGGK